MVSVVAMFYGLVQQQATLLSFLSEFRLRGFLFLLIIPLVFLIRRPKRTIRLTPPVADP
jgi:hypothetical protein